MHDIGKICSWGDIGVADAICHRAWDARIDDLILEYPVCDDCQNHAAIRDVDQDQIGIDSCLDHMIKFPYSCSVDDSVLSPFNVVPPIDNNIERSI